MPASFYRDAAILNDIRARLRISPVSIAAIGSSRNLPAPNPGSDLDLVLVVPRLTDFEITRTGLHSNHNLIRDEQGIRLECKFSAAGIPVDVTILDPGATRMDGDPTRDRYELFLGLIENARTIAGVPLRESLNFDDHFSNWESRRAERIRAVRAKLSLTENKIARRDDWYTIMELQDLLFTLLCLERGVFPPCSVKHANSVFRDFDEMRDRILARCGLRVRIDRVNPPLV